MMLDMSGDKACQRTRVNSGYTKVKVVETGEEMTVVISVCL